MRQPHPISSVASPTGALGAAPSADGHPRRRLAWLAQRRQRPPRPSVSPAVVEEEAANLLYGERTGTVNASPAVPPVSD